MTHPFSVEDIKILKEIALFHEIMTITKLDPDSLQSILLRLLDFECLTRYQSWHEEKHGLSKNLATRAYAYAISKEFMEKELECELPTFLLLGNY